MNVGMELIMNNMQDQTSKGNFLSAFKNNIKTGFISILEYVKLLIIALILSYIVGFILLFLYTAEYGAPFPIYSNLLTDFAKLFFILFGIGVIFSLGPENLFKFISSLIIGITVIIMVLGIFAKWQYSPQRIFLRQFNLGGRTEKITFLKKKYYISGTPKRAYLIYKGNNFFYYYIKHSAEGINKECLLDRIH